MHGKCLPAAAPDFPIHLQGFTYVIRMEESGCALSGTIWGHPWGEGLEGDEHLEFCFDEVDKKKTVSVYKARNTQI